MMKIETVPTYRIAYMRQAWSSIFTELANYGFQLDDRPIMERYQEEMLSQDDCEICIPIQ